MTQHSAARKSFYMQWQQGICYTCPVRLTDEQRFWQRPNFATFDHVRPRSQGPWHLPGNYALACRQCNEAAGCQRPTACEILFGDLAYDAWANLNEIKELVEQTTALWRKIKQFWCGDRRGPDWPCDIELMRGRRASRYKGMEARP